MEKQIEVMKQTTELLDTTFEGLKHTQDLLKEGKFEAAVSIFTDIVQAFSSIESSIKGLPSEYVSTDIEPLTNKVRKAIELVVSSFETKSYGTVQEVLQFTLIPMYNKWKVEIEKTFNPYLVS